MWSRWGRGLSILVPDLVGIDNDKIAVNANAEQVAFRCRGEFR